VYVVRAIVQDGYCGPEELRLEELPKPEVGDDEILVEVKASSVNPFDWHAMRGEPAFARLLVGLRRPKVPIRGLDVAGVVEAVGASVTEFRPGDEVFGHRPRAFAEYVTGKEDRFVKKPASLSFEEAAAIPVAGMTALQGLRDKGGIQADQKVLITGASGGVGSFAVQIAKSFGAEVTGVCSTPNLELVRSLGADHVIDYTKEDFTTSGKRYDLIVYAAGTHSLRECRRVLTPNGTFVGVGSSKTSNFFSVLMGFALPHVMSRFTGQTFATYLTNGNKADLVFLAKLVEEGKLRPVVGRTYPLEQTPAAIAYQELGHARGKVIITV
jgi:NADPH:quinone reductase-like Zn-dependent oxidoreductase